MTSAGPSAPTALEEAHAFWQAQLDAFAELPPAEDPPPAAPRQRLELELGDGALDRLAGDELGRLTVLLSSLALVLGRRPAASHVVVRVPALAAGAAGDRRELPLVLPVPAEATRRELLLGVAAVVEQAYTLQGAPAGGALAELRRLAAAAGAPWIRVPALHGASDSPPAGPELELAGVRLRVSYPAERAGDHDLARAALLLPPAVRALAELERPCADVSLLRPGESPGVGLSALETPLPPTSALSLFLVQANQRPDAVAVASRTRCLSYAGLERSSRALAAAVRARSGGRAEWPVAVCLERSVELIVAMLGVMRAGAALIPVDPAYPAARARTILRGSGARLLLTGHAPVAAPEGLERVAVRTLLGGEPGAPLVAPHPKQLAYVLYTSGSTGEPKGVEVPHGALGNYAAWAGERYGRRAGYPLLTSIGFDLSLTSIFGALCHGGTLELVDEGLDAATAVRRALSSPRATHVKLTPSHAALLAGGRPSRSAIRCAVLGGEVLDAHHCQLLRELAPGLRIENEYGPTETTVGCAAETVGARPDGSVGLPARATALLVQDRYGQPAGPGWDGELCVAGAGLARGYRGAPALTAARFLPSSRGRGARLYRTGDRAHLRDDGCVVFRGRLDRQLKVRGHRVEPGEVEACLRAYPGVSDAAVLLVGGDTLCAYVVATGLQPETLRAHCAAQLPSAFVPDRVLLRAALPRTPHGKLDRRALAADPPAPEPTAAPAGDASPAEALLASLWQELLGVPRVTPDDDFFELGGHSLSAVTLVARLWDEHGIELDVTAVFDRPRLRELAAELPGGEAAPERAAAPAPAPEQEAPARAPLSAAQERVWSHCRLQPDATLYHTGIQLELRGPLDPRLLERSLAALAARHPSLRTAFPVQAGVPFQEVRPAGEGTLPFQHVAQAGDDDPDELIAAEAARPFDLEGGPLWRALLVSSPGERHRFAWTLHHLISDDRSLRLLLAELTATYGALAEGRQPALPPPGPSPIALALAERAAAAAALQAHAAFWREELADLPELELPADRPPQSRRAGGAGLVRARLAPATAGILRRLAAAEAGTLSMAMLTGFALFIARTADAWDLVIGVASAQRQRLQAQRTVGLLLDALPLRLRLLPDAGLRENLRAVRHATLRALGHAELPVERVRREPGSGEGGEPAPLYRLWYDFVSADGAPPALSGITVREVFEETGTAKFDLSLLVSEAHSGELDLVLEFRRTLFERDTAESLLRAYVQLLAAIAGEPERAGAELPLVDPGERRLLLALGQGPRTSRPVPVLERFQARAAARPDAPALLDGDTRIAYGRLATGTRNLGALLRARHALGAGDVVAVHCERSWRQVVAVLSILEAGAAFLPIDPHLPAERRRRLIAAAGARLVVCAPEPALPEGLDVPHWVLDEADDVLAAPPAELNVAPWDPAAPAYVLYTSGSTGEPKACVISRAALANYLHWAVRAYFADLRGDTLLFTALGFDFTLTCLFGPLLRGGTLRIAGQESVDEALRSAFAPESGLDVLKLTPAHVTLLQHVGLTSTKVRRVVVGGEALRPEQVALLHGLSPALEVINEYGPTEATVGCVIARVAPGTERIPIGRPIPNMRAYVLDERGGLLPRGVPGELYLAGAGLAAGYLGRPAETQARFVPDPFVPGERMYRSGDRAAWTAGGELRFLGRRDDQVKLRGHRVELGEVEAALAALPGVADAAVTFHRVRDSELLAAHLVPAPGETLILDEVRAALARRLPGYMVPQRFALREALPLTRHGKLDRRRLRLPQPVRAAAPDPSEVLSPALETLRSLWEDVLGVQGIGLDDDFFALGGDSIQVVALTARALALGLPLAPQDLFETPTIRGLAGRVAAGPVAPGEPAADSDALSPIQRWYFAEVGDLDAVYNQSILLELPAGVEAPRLEEALTLLGERHEALHTGFVRAGDALRRRPLEFPREALARVDLADLSEAEADAAIAHHAGALQRSLAPAEGRVLRALLFERGPRPARLFIVAHHLAIDAVSWRILADELATIVRAGADALPPPPTSVSRWVGTLARLAEDPAACHAEFWRRQAAQSPPPLPDDLPPAGTPDRMGDAAELTCQLSSLDTDRLLVTLPATTTWRIHEALAAALLDAVHAWTGRDRLQLDLEGHGRAGELPGVDLASTVGWLTTLYPLILHRGPGGALARLERVAQTLRAVPARGLGYGALRYLSPDADLRQALAAAPRSSVILNYLGRLDAPGGSPEGWRPLFLPTGDDQGPELRRPHALGVQAAVIEGRLRVSVEYSRRRHDPATAQRLLEGIRRGLEDVVVALPAEDAAEVARPRQAPPAHEEDVAALLPLAPVQAGILFHALYDPSGLAYLEQLSCTLRGTLDLERLTRAWQRATDRHAVLRSVFRWVGVEAPTQVVLRRTAVQIEVEDWRGRDPATHETALAEWLAADRGRGVRLDAPPLWRLTAIRLAPEEWRLVWTHHHILLDGWSTARVLGEVLEAYGRDEGPREAPAAAPSYADYLSWIDRQDRAAARRAWRAALGGLHRPSPLPAGRPDPRARDRQQVAHLVLDAGLTRSIDELARTEGLTPSTVLRGAWALLLSREGAGAEVVFGAVVAGRPPQLVGSESIVGLFINTIPLRFHLGGADPLASWLATNQREHAALEALAYCGLSEIQDCTQVPRGRELFQSILVFENYPVDPRAATSPGGLEIDEPVVFEQNNYALSLACVPGERLRLRLRYGTERYGAADARRLLEGLRSVLAACVAAPSAPLAQLGLRREPARVPAAAAADRRSIPARIAALARERPDALALQVGARHLSRAGLAARSSGIAGDLRRRGVRAEVPVGVLLPRGLEAIVAALAVWTSGGVWVPLDPSLPAGRLAAMCAALELETILCHEETLALARGCAADPLPIETLGRGAPAAARVPPRSLAYVLFSSGTTGEPKPIAVEHGSLAALLEALQATVHAEDVARPRRVGLNGPLTFDTSLKQLIQLADGHALVLVEEETRRDPARLVELARAARLDVLDSTPSQLQALLEAGLGELADLRLLVGGEAIPQALWDRLAAAPVQAWNLYGPTEATVDSSCARIVPGPPHAGHALPGWSLAVADADGSVAAGATGELVIAGAGVARGYSGRPRETAARFVPAPAGGRSFRSGDRARFRSGGEVELLGRLDRQVKVHGYRVELSAVEAALEAHPRVRRAAVVAGEAGQGPLLQAYLQVADPAPNASELLRFLARSLPAWMRPGAFLTLDAWPLDPHGKLDHRRLPELAARRLELTGYRPPRNASERGLVELWERVLGIPRVGIHDSFFELGGNSLAALRLAGALRAELGRELPLAVLFEEPTVAHLAAWLRRGGPTPPPRSPLVPLRRRDASLPLLLVPGAGGNVLCFHTLAGRLGLGQAVYGLQSIGLEGEAPPLESVEAIAGAYLDELRAAGLSGPYVIAGHSFGGKVAFEMGRQLLAAGEPVGRVVLLDTPAPLFARIAGQADWSTADWLHKIAREIEEFLGVDLAVAREALAALSEPAQLELLAARLRTAGVLPPEGGAELVRGYAAVYRASHAIDYRPPAVPLPLPLSLIRTRGGEAAPEDHPQLARLQSTPHWGWQELSTLPVAVSEVGGDHLSMLGEPHAGELAAVLRETLERVRQARRTP